MVYRIEFDGHLDGQQTADVYSTPDCVAVGVPC